MKYRPAPNEPGTFNIWINNELITKGASLEEINNLDGDPEIFRAHLNQISNETFKLHDCGHNDASYGWQVFKKKDSIANIKYRFQKGETDPIVWIGTPDIGGDIMIYRRRLSEQIAGVKGWLFRDQKYQNRGLIAFQFISTSNQYLTTIHAETAIEAANALHKAHK